MLARNRLAAGRYGGRITLWCLIAVFAVVACPAFAAPPAVDPAINAPYERPDVDYWRGVFENDRREIYANRHRILAALDLRPGMTVADIGAGTGFFSLMFAEAVGPAGQVYAADISPDFVHAIEERAQGLALGNLTGVVNGPRDVKLPAGTIDLAFISDTYHHFEYPQDMLRTLRDALKPGGDVVIVDFRRVPGQSSPWVMGHVRAGADTVRAELEDAGFELVEQRDFMRTQFYLRFRKVPYPAPGDAGGASGARQ